MARVWRDGQCRQVYIYRLLTTGTLEEKMYQRQVAKQALSGVVVDAKLQQRGQQQNFSPEELKDIFRLHENADCCTHELLGCRCQMGKPKKPTATTVKPARACSLQPVTQGKQVL